MSNHPIMLPRLIHIPDNRHKYQRFQRVRCINPEHAMYGKEGSIDSPMVYFFEYPAYDVLWDGAKKVMAMSERSLEPIL